MPVTSEVALLNEVAFNIGTLRQAKKRFAANLAPEFSIFDYLRADEMALSSCIAGLLDPSGNHGQGSVFLRDFLEKIRPDVEWIKLIKRHESCVVTMEKKANDQRRIDVHLTFDEGFIGIENKPWAGDQPNQLLDYAEYLRGSALAPKREWLLVYLSNGDPSEKSISLKERHDLYSAGSFQILGYQTLIEWLERCRAKSKAPNVSMFVEELIKFVRIKVNGENEMAEELETCNTILSSKESLGSAFQIYKAMDGVKRELLLRFKKNLENEFVPLHFTLLWDDNLDSNWRSYVGFKVKFYDDQNVYLGFEFASSGLTSFEWGITRRDSTVAKDPAVWESIREVMKREGFGDGKANDAWPWYVQETKARLSVDLSDWNRNELPWVMILDGSLVELITKLASDVAEAFSTNQSLLKVGLSTKPPVVTV